MAKEDKRNTRVQLRKLSEEEKYTYMRIALNLQHVGVDQLMAKRIVMTYERIGILGGNFSIDDAVEIDMIIKEDAKELKDNSA